MRRASADFLLGSAPVTRFYRMAIRGKLRILAYHDVPDPTTFELHLAHLQTHYQPISGAHVAWAIRTSRPLPSRCVWITFDDARPGVFRHALPLLQRRALPATLFACPGVVGTTEPFWWQVVDLALQKGHTLALDGRNWVDRRVVSYLKRVPDPQRRIFIKSLRETLENDSGERIAVEQATEQQLRSWLAADLELGNHSWDHPCLDTCSPAEQHRQIVDAHEWFRTTLNVRTELFAYPNGDRTAVSNRLLTDNGYSVKLMFDHRLACTSRTELSRLRIDAGASPARLAAIVSGAHPIAFRLLSARRNEPRLEVAQGHA